jgi:hypothetical protein
VKSHNTKDPKSAASSRRTPAFGIVSDDFAGGLLVASYFEEAGIECPVYFEPMVAKEDRPSGGIVVIVTRSRLDPVSEARRQIAVALDVLVTPWDATRLVIRSAAHLIQRNKEISV